MSAYFERRNVDTVVEPSL